MNDVTHQILLLIMIHFGFTTKVVDIETAFLYGDSKEEIFMECPPSMRNVTKRWLYQFGEK